MINNFSQDQRKEVDTEERVRKMMLRQRITFQEAKILVEKGQKALFEF